MSGLIDFWKHIYCRVAYGHIMIPYGNDSKLVDGRWVPRQYTWYMCARCLLCQRLNCIGRDKDAE